MKLRAPFFREDLGHDQPYMSLLLICPYCDFRCAGCQNAPLASAEVRDFTVEQLSTIYQNSFADGITIAGLECMLSGQQFLDDVIEFVQYARIPYVTIYSRFRLGYRPLQEFCERLCAIESTMRVYCKTGEYIRGRPMKKIGDIVLVEGQQWHELKNVLKYVAV